MFDFDGEQQTVNAPGGTGYLVGESFAAVSVADYIFIVNRSKTCSMKPTGSDEAAQADYLRWLSKTTSWSGSDVGGFGGVIDYVASGGAYQYAPNPQSGSYMGELASMEKLPDTAAEGAIYKITGSAESRFVSYYVRRSGAVWDETVKPGEQNALDETTLPHALIREADGTFTFAPFSWAPRRVGDSMTNPVPSFVGRTIQDVYFDQNRLAFLVDENATLSCTGDFGNFWRTTVLDAIATDVVDVAVTTAQVSLLLHATLFNDGVMLFADQTQFSMTNAEEGLTASSISIRPVTHYRINKRVKPVVVGTEVYFCGDQAGSSVIWEYTRQSDVDSTNAAEITAHVPGYVPGNLKQLVALPKGLLALTGDSRVFTYQLYWSGNDKVQSAWREWEMTGTPISGSFVDSQVFLVIRRNDGVFLEKMEMAPNAIPPNQPRPVHLDRLTVVQGVYDPVADRTSFRLPYDPRQAAFEIIRGNDSTAPHSLIDPAQYVWVNPFTVTVPGNEAKLCTVGERYAMVLRFSEQFPRD